MKFKTTQSMRARLLWFLLLSILVIASIQAAVAYRTALSETDEIFDYQMQQMAMSLRSGLPTSGDVAELAESDEDNFDLIVQVWTANGVRVFQSTARTELPQQSSLGFSNVDLRGIHYRIYSMVSGPQLIQVAQDMASRRHMAETLALRTVAPMVLMVPVLMFVVWWVVGASLARVTSVRAQIATRQANDLSEVSEVDLPDEIFPLVHELNLLLQRVRQAFDAQKAFVADAAHELRTPLAALKLQVHALRRATGQPSQDTALERLNAGIDRATRMVEQLLTMARQQADGAPAKLAVNMQELVQQEVSDLLSLAQTRQIAITVAPGDPCSVLGNPDALRILVRNLLDNAIKYSPIGGSIKLTLRHQTGLDKWVVEDSGPGIPVELHNRLFDRFYRVPGSLGTGSGLGLAIVKAIADLHGADIALGTSKDLGGLMVTVQFGRRPASLED